ncbi:MAG TPA: hypothetical protein VMD07_10005 [Candidatus Acidoferrales bacterium]|nr:hypothetical protein [Candidatus Acidoferrales bacterium]
MKRLLLVVALIVAAFVYGDRSVAVANTTSKIAAEKKIAPADEYFGRLKMSILGIANTIKDQTVRFDRRPEEMESEMSTVSFAVDAIRDWEHKYPRDPWIAKSLFFVERFYNRIPTDAGRAQAKATMAWLVRDFPNTWYGKTGKRELAEGKVGAVPPPNVVQSPPPAVDVTRPVLGQNSQPAPQASP